MFLTDKAIRNAKPKTKVYRLKDGDGLYLQVEPNGSKCWRFRYFFGSKEKMMSFGTYPEVPLLEARDKRLEARRQLSQDIDPGAVKKEKKRLAVYNTENTFEAVAKEWFDNNQAKWTPDHAARLWRRLEANILPEIGRRPIADIKSLELLDALRKIEKRGATELSRRLLQTCGVIFRYAVVTQRIEHSPAGENLRGALRPHKAKNYPTITAKELPHFYKQLEAVETSKQNKLAIHLLMLTFVRQGELRQAKWEDIDFQKKQWRLPAHTTKMRDTHIVPLAKQTITLLKELQTLTGKGELLFPSQQRRRHKIMSENTINYILHKMGFKDKLVGHGFRALASTSLNEMGFHPDAIERQLAHMERNKIKAAYNHAQYMDKREDMMQKWADYLESMAAAKVITGKFNKVRHG